MISTIVGNSNMLNFKEFLIAEDDKNQTEKTKKDVEQKKTEMDANAKNIERLRKQKETIQNKNHISDSDLAQLDRIEQELEKRNETMTDIKNKIAQIYTDYEKRIGDISPLFSAPLRALSHFGKKAISKAVN